MRENTEKKTVIESKTVIRLVHMRTFLSQGQILCALFEIDISIEGQSLCFWKRHTKN